ncbi:DUF6318 family protein [Pengzhenrongella phosphoraccumulans]|uniref:DUF6318 family protein n=1 Tax=Pengzhenrongella phosphoraccumulans TaxID=3114394 RepID=UPI00388F6DD2
MHDGDGILRVGAIRATTLAFAAALTLAGCTATAAPAPSAPGTPGIVHPAGPTTTPSPTPTPIAPPQRPAAMDRDDTEGAIAAATYFISLYPYAYASGDLLAWNAMSDPACGYCSGVSEAVKLLHGAGTRIDGGEIEVAAAKSFPLNASTGIYPIDLELVESPSREVAANGSVRNEMTGGRTLAQLDIAWSSLGWSIHAVKTTDEPDK